MARQLTSGDLRTPITFFSYEPVPGFNIGEQKKETLHYCFCEIYASSQKDLEILKTVHAKESITINIRDPLMDYIPDHTHFAEIGHYRYIGKVWNIVEVRPDAQSLGFINIVLAVV
ncbi:MAG TPA: phage head-tail adapter protein [Candidatus Kurthia intestinigallinarum]|nr:phage head-tail adapter protein [Candidatus Kurthia intestinigallinarum]